MCHKILSLFSFSTIKNTKPFLALELCENRQRAGFASSLELSTSNLGREMTCSEPGPDSVTWERL